MKLVSSDVGIRNLAFCIIQGTNRTNVKILEWNLIDVMAESAGLDTPLCYKCKKNANYKCGDKLACSLHKTRSEKPPTKSSLVAKEVAELQQECQRLKIELLGKTKKECVDKLYLYYTSRVWKRCVKSSKQGSVVDLARPIAKSLEARKKFWEGSDLIVFEQQPDKRMLTIQAMLHMWFECNGYKTKGVSASHKLTNITTVDDKTTTYGGRKKTGILHASQLVLSPERKKFMMSHPKKDDLADSFLQGLWVMEH